MNENNIKPTWQKDTPGIVVLLDRLRVLHLRLTRLALLKKLHRSQSVLAALVPPAKRHNV